MNCISYYNIFSEMQLCMHNPDICKIPRRRVQRNRQRRQPEYNRRLPNALCLLKMLLQHTAILLPPPIEQQLVPRSNPPQNCCASKERRQPLTLPPESKAQFPQPQRDRNISPHSTKFSQQGKLTKKKRNTLEEAQET
jgi:hypothetical protein